MDESWSGAGHLWAIGYADVDRVLDHQGDMGVILHNIRALGGTVLKTNVDVERAKLIRATLTGTPGALKADTISAAELALSQKAFEITRPFGFPITDSQHRRRPAAPFSRLVLSPGPSHRHGPRQARFVTMDAATPAMP